MSQLPQAFSKGCINQLSRKGSYASAMIHPVINGLSPNEVRSNLQIFDNPIIDFEKIGLCLGFSNTSHVESLYRFRKSVDNKVKLDIIILMKQKY